MQDSVFFAHAIDESRSSDHGQHHSVRHGHPRRRGPVLDVFHSYPIHRGSAHVPQHNHEWGPLAGNLYPNHALRVQPDHSHDSIAFASPWNDETYVRPETDGLLPLSNGVFPPPTNAELSLRLQEVHTYNAFTSYPNAASGEPSFPQNDGPLILPYRSPHYVDRAVSTFGQTHPNQIQLSSGSQGPPLITSEKYVRWNVRYQLGGDAKRLMFPRIQWHSI